MSHIPFLSAGRLRWAVILLLGWFAAGLLPGAAPEPVRTFGLVLHGGAGVIQREELSPVLEAEYRTVLGEALDAGYAELDRGGTAVDAVVAAVRIMEDSPLFNAGRGAVLNADGFCELDAAIMDGRNRAAGTIAGVQRVQNPILLAREVMVSSPHVMMIGTGAERFAEERGLALVDNAYFQTERRRQQLQRAQQREATEEDGARVRREEQERVSERQTPWPEDHKFGTVGVVALDQAGNLAAGTSTGGLTNKRYGRVGDVPIIGAGTYADNASCAISATGQGEYFIRAVVGHGVATQMRLGGLTLAEAVQTTLADVAALGGSGGVVAMDASGDVVWHFTTPGMYRAQRRSDGTRVIAIFGDE